MNKNYFQNIANQENGKFLYEEFNVSVDLGVKHRVEKYTLLFNYKEASINVVNQFGTSNSGSIYCTLPENISLPKFKVESLSHFLNLFFQKRKRFKVISNDSAFKQSIEISFEKHLKSLMKDRDFSPIVYSKFNKEGNQIIIEYHLAFSGQLEVLNPLISFIKDTVDELLVKSEFNSRSTYS